MKKYHVWIECEKEIKEIQEDIDRSIDMMTMLGAQSQFFLDIKERMKKRIDKIFKNKFGEMK